MIASPSARIIDYLNAFLKRKKKNVNTFTTLSLRKYDKCVIESAQNSTRDVPQNLQLLAAVYKMVVQYKLNCPVGMLHSISQTKYLASIYAHVYPCVVQKHSTITGTCSPLH